jgi:hypothetical protein
MVVARIVKAIDYISIVKNCLLTNQTRLTIDNINVTNKKYKS